jgi:hypothetical protein
MDSNVRNVPGRKTAVAAEQMGDEPLGEGKRGVERVHHGRLP